MDENPLNILVQETKVKGSRGPYAKMKGILFLSSYGNNLVWFDMVIGIDQLNTHNGITRPDPYIDIFEYKR